jgi:choline dehydrogenase
VVRIILDPATSGPNGTVHARGVTFIDNASGLFHNVSCSKEVILAAGAFHSPFILMQSGIGPEEELRKYNIERMVVNENVGRHMQDHTSFSVVHAVKPEFADIASTSDMVSLLLLFSPPPDEALLTSEGDVLTWILWSTGI